MSARPRRTFLRNAGAVGGSFLLGIPPLARGQQSPAPGRVPVTGLDDAALANFDDLMTEFVAGHKVRGAALAVTSGARLVYARGFGVADADRRRMVEPGSLFRIASISKPVTAVAVLQLVERSKLSLDARVWELLGPGEPSDARWKAVTVRQLLHHTGGWDSAKSFDPMFRPAAIARALGISPPVEPAHVVRYMLSQPLDFDPGARYAYSNFGYCLLGRVIERASGMGYEAWVRQEVLAPLGIRRMRLGRTAPALRAPAEVDYEPDSDRAGTAAAGAESRRKPSPIGSWSLEVMDAHGGWIAAAPDLARFAAAFDVPAECPILQPRSVAAMFARPDGPAGYEEGGGPRPVYYGCGWSVRQAGRAGQFNSWHAGALDGTSTLLVRRHDGRNWAVLFNARNAPDGRSLSSQIDLLVHRAADRVRRWPEGDQFSALL